MRKPVTVTFPNHSDFVCEYPVFKANSIALLTLALLFLNIASASPANADGVYTYTYTGSRFTAVGGQVTCPPDCSITGYFTLSSPLPVNNSNFIISGYSAGSAHPYSFTSGEITITGTDGGSGLFAVSTDANGLIVGWEVDLTRGIAGSGYFQILSQPQADTFTQYDSVGHLLGVGSNSSMPGTWAIATQIPEPPRLVMFGFGVLGLMGVSIIKWALK